MVYNVLFMLVLGCSYIIKFQLHAWNLNYNLLNYVFTNIE